MSFSAEKRLNGALSDEALAAAVQRGDKNALSVLIARYRPAAEKAASRLRSVSLETDDFVQEAMLALLSAAYTYAPDKNASYKTYAAVCVKNRLRSVLRAEAAAKNAPLNTYLSLDELSLADGTDLEAQLISAEETKALEASLDRVLSALEKQVLLCRLEGLRYADISARLHITEKSIDNALQRVRVKLKKFIKA
jgi:RNA polymerase sporulation-specific sigma factor